MTSEEDISFNYGGGEFLTAAERLAKDLHGEGQPEVMSIIASRYARLAQFDHAIELAETISDPFTRDNTFAEIAAASITNGTPEYANALLEMIDDPSVRCVAIEEVAVKYAELGDLDVAIELANALGDADPPLRRIALVGNTFSPRSVEVASSITDPELRSSALGQLAILAHRAEREPEATDLLADSLQASDEIEFSQNQIHALVNIAALHHEIGDPDQAAEILADALKLCENFEGMPAIGLPASFPRDQALAQIVEAFARLGRFDRADVAAEQIEDPFQFAHASTKEALEYYKTGQTEQALTLLPEALELVLEEPVYGGQGLFVRDTVLTELAVAYVTVGQWEKSLQITRELSSEAQRYAALELVGKECARTANSRGIIQAAESITNHYSATSYWLAVTDVLRAASEIELAHQTSVEAATSAGMIQDNYEKATSLIDVGYRFALMDKSAEASELFLLALKTINEPVEDDKKALALLSLDERFRELNRRPNEEERYLLA